MQTRAFSSLVRSVSVSPPSQRRRVVITGVGLVTPLGIGSNFVWNRLIQGACGVVSLSGHPDHDFDRFHFPSMVAGLIPRGTAEGHYHVDDWVSKADQVHTSPFIHYAHCAASQALRQARWQPATQHQKDRSGVAIGCGVGDIQATYESGRSLYAEDGGGYKRVSPYFLPRILINLAAGHVSIAHGLCGPNLAAATACTTGAHAIGDAFRAIQYGDADVMVAGGTEASINPLTVAGFARLRALSTKFNARPAEASRPFDSQRDGFVLGEGAAVMVLEEYEHARARGVEMLAEVRGYGLSADAHHITSPSPSAHGAVLCMRNALRDAELHPQDVSYINAHATSTPVGDAVENAAFHQLLGTAAHAAHVAISSTKGAIGHTLGAAGAIEAAFCVLSVVHNVVPPTLNLTSPSEGFDLNYVPLQAQPRHVEVAMSNSFGFGGTNACIVFSKVRK